MVLLDNKDCKMTEALMLGIEESIVLYLKSVTHSEPGVLENGNGTSS
jgi:hypothetical protein